MLPVMLDLTRGPVILYGDGPAAVRRLELVRAAGADDIRLFSPGTPSPGMVAAARDAAIADVIIGPPGEADISAALVVFVADAPDGAAVAACARRHRVLVNVEDDIPHCDFYMPSMVRRGDLVLAISTGGKSPGLARRLRQKFEQEFGPEWAERLVRIGAARDEWRAEGLDMPTVAARTNEMIEKEGWL